MPTTIQQALAQAEDLRKVSDSWRLDAELLLAEALHTSRERLRAWPLQELDPEQLQTYLKYLRRRSDGEPIAYILGKKAFWDFELTVNSQVLIPRPETELLVETTLELLSDSDNDDVCIADLGTGSGAIAIALARANSRWRVAAVDISEGALEVARQNAESLALNNIEFILASWCAGFRANLFDIIVANPPYVATDDVHLEHGDLRFEPSIALVAHNSGLGDIASIVSQSRNHLKKDAWLLLEHGYNQAAAVERIFRENGFNRIECKKDYASLDRMTIGQGPGPALKSNHYE